MKLRIKIILLALSFIISGIGSVYAADAEPSRADQVTAIQKQYGTIFDTQWVRLQALATKVKGDASTNSQYKAAVIDFLEVRRVIDDGLASSSSDLVAVQAYAEEETGEFAMTISQIEKSAASIKAITCIKGKTSKKVTGIKPVCPKGYTKKK